MKRLIFILTYILTLTMLWAQNTITGTLTGLPDQSIKLMGFQGFDTYAIDSTRTNANGAFTLSFAEKDEGMGILLSENKKSFVIVLAGNEHLKLTGKDLSNPDAIRFINGPENKLFERYAKEHARREQTLNAWEFMKRIYTTDSLFAVHQAPKQAIENEMKRIQSEDSLFLEHLPEHSYVRFYLPLRKLISAVPQIVRQHPEKIPATVEAFRNIDYTDHRLYKSGLLQMAIESQFWMLQNSRQSPPVIYKEMEISIDRLLDNLQADEEKLKEITEFLFKLLEKNSLVKASEYLALRLLNENACSLDDDFASQLESYRAMQVGHIAPDIVFSGDMLVPEYKANNVPKKLSELKSRYKVLIFGAGWCPHCQDAFKEIVKLYPKWHQKGIEIVFISLDDDKKTFDDFTKNFPFISVCDYRKWQNQAVKDYHVFATPTIYMLDANNKILLKPNDVNQLNDWIKSK